MNKRRNTRILQISIGLLICMHALSGNYTFLHNLRFGSQINWGPAIATQGRAVRAHFDLRILAVDGIPLEKPIYFSQDSEELISDPTFNRESGLRLIRKIGHSLVTESTDKLELYQSELHENYLVGPGFESVEYEIVMLPYQPTRVSQSESSQYLRAETLLTGKYLLN